MAFPGCQRVRSHHSRVTDVVAACRLLILAMLAIQWPFGSEQGTCVFIEDEAAKKEKAKCRHDFYQVGSTVSLSIYAKKTDPEQCTFRASSHQLSLEIGYEAGTKSYSLDVRLFGPIDPTKCAPHDSRCDYRMHLLMLSATM